MKTILLLILFATIGFTPDNASACSCSGPQFENELRIGNGVIPENARGLGWHFTRAEQAGALEELVKVTRLDQPAVDDGFIIEPVGFPSGIYTNSQVATVFVIRPNEWEVGARFEVSTVFKSDESSTDDGDFARGIFEIGEPLVSFPQDVWVSDTNIETIQLNEPAASCYADVLGSVATIGLSGLSDINLTNLHFETFVDGVLYEQTSSMCEYIEPGRNWYRPHRSWGEFDSNRLVAICDSGYEDVPGLTPGTHTVQIRTTLPGTSVSFETSPTVIKLTCPKTASEDTNNADFADTNSGNDGGCTSIRSSPVHPIIFFLFILATIRFRRK